MISLRHLLFIFLSLLLLGSSAPGAQVTLTAVADTALWQRETNHNLGGSDLLIAGTTGSDGNASGRMLFRFDVAGGLPSNAVIESATNYLRVVRAPSSAANPAQLSTFSIRRILKPWGEGNKTYADSQAVMTSTTNATAGEATWIQRFFGDDASRWIIPGGDLNDGDFAETASGDFFMQLGKDRDYTFPLNATGLTDLREWLIRPELNFGWVLKSDSEGLYGTARIIASREYATAAYRPQLTITYSLLNQAPLTITRNSSLAIVSFPAQAGTRYVPQFRSVVHAGPWTDLTELGPLASAGVLQFTNNLPANAERYFRVIIP